MASNIRVTVEFNENAQKHFIKCQKKNNNLYFKVSIPSPLIGVNEELRVNDKWHGKLIKRSNKEDQPFLFSIFSPITNKKDVTENNVIILECQVSPQRRCKVRLTKFKNRNVNLFQLNTCEVLIPKLVSSNAEMRIIAKGDIRIMAIVESPIITLKSKEGNVTVTSEGTLRTSSLNMKCSTANVDGIICGLSGSFFRSHYTHANTTKPCEDNIINSIHLAIVGNLNVGTDGKIGCGRKNVSNSLVAFLEITVTENICNFGIITAFSQISLEARNMLSGKNCKVDTVQRNYNNIIELHGLQKDVKDTEIEPTISNLILAVKNQKVEQVASLLQSGVDPSLPALKHGKTVQDLASEELWKKTEKDPQYGYERNRANLVYSLIKAWDKRSGSIISRIIKCSLKGDIEDCSQLLGLVEVYFDVNGDITVEEDSIWTSGNVTGRCKGNFTFDGRTNLQEFHNMVIENTCHIKNTGTVLLAEGGTLSVKKWLKNNGVLYVYSQDIKSQLHVTTDVFEQTRNAKMVSNSLLQLTILADTAEWEGDMKGKSVCFDVRAKVQTFCNIESAHLCLIKIMEGKNGTGQFILGQKGLITVTDGKFVAVRENCESRKLADILVNGKLSSKGIHAIDVKVELLDNSFVEVLQNSHCFIKDLRTKQKSTIHFTVSEKCKPVVCKIDYWSHFGKMKVKKMSPVSCVLNVEAFTILQNGKIENCDQMNLNIKEEMINTKEIIVKKEFVITGPGNICNRSVIKSQHGVLKIDQVARVNICPGAKLEGKEILICTSLSKDPSHLKWDFKNKGKIISDERTLIKAWNIQNISGEIRSQNSRIDMIWMTHHKACLDGIVTAPRQIALFANCGKHLLFKCIGGGSASFQENNVFNIPDDGLRIECSKGDVWICSEINGTSLFETLSKKGILFAKTATLSVLYIEAETAKPMTDIESHHTSSSWINITDYENKIDEIVEKNGCMKIKDADFSIRLIQDSNITVNETAIKCNDKASTIVFKTYKCSQFIVTHSIFADCKNYMNGSFKFVGYCLVEAHSLNFIRQSQCLMSPDEDKNEALLSIRGNNLLSFDGRLTNNCPSEIELSAANIHLSGEIESKGELYLNNATDIKIEGAQIASNGLFCKQSDSSQNYPTVTLLGGLTNVIGSMVCCVKDFTIDKMSVLKVQTKDHCVISATSSANVSGKFECSGQGIVQIECGENIVLEEDTDLKFFLNKVILKAGKVIRTNRNSVLEFNGETLELSTGKEEDENVEGEILLSGDIYFSAFNTETIACLEIECRDLQLTGSTITGFKSFEINAAAISTDWISSIKNVETVKLEASHLDAQGQISTIKNMEVKVDNVLVRGIVKQVCDLKIDAQYTVVNCGTLHSDYTGITAPVFLNCPELNKDGEKSLLNSLPTLGNSKELIVEGLLCIIVGSFVQGTKIKISSVMRFDFSNKTSTKLPNSSDLSNWRNIVDSSLCKLSSNSEDPDISGIVLEALKIPQVCCHLGVGSHLCRDIVNITEGIQKQGLSAFQLKDIVFCLNKAHTEYTRISYFQMDIKVIPKKLKKVKNTLKKVGKKMMETIFGRDSFTSMLEFKKNDDGKESIESQSFVFLGDNTDVTTGQYMSKSLVLGADKGIWKNAGVLESCGDIIISAKVIEHGDKQKRLMRSIHGCIQMQADKVKTKALESKSLHVSSTQQLELESVDVKKDAELECVSGHATVKELKSESLNLAGQANVVLGTLSVDDNMKIAGNNVEAQDVSSKDMVITATKSVLVDGATVENVEVQSSGNAEIKQINASDIDIVAEKNVGIGLTNTKNKLSVKSNSGNIEVNSKIKTDKTEFVAEKGKISLKSKHSVANHEIKQLIIRTKQLNDVQEILSQTGVYRDLKIAEEMDLAVPEQSVILAKMDKKGFGLKLTARDIDVKSNFESSKGIYLNASDGSLKIEKNVRVRGEEDVSLTAKNEISIKEGASVEAVGDINLESKESSVSCTAVTIKTDNSVEIKAAKDINILSKNGDGPAKKSNIISENSKGTTDTPSTVLMSGRDLNISASNIQSRGQNKILADRDINITGHTYQKHSMVKKKKCLGLKTETTTKITTYVDKSEIDGNKNIFIAGRNFSSLAGKLKSDIGQEIHAQGKVTMKNIVTSSSEHKSTNVLGGLLYHRSDHSQFEQSHGTLVEDTSSIADTKIISETADIEWTGSSIKSCGELHEEVKMGKVVHQSQILTNKKSTTEYGFFTSSSSDNSYKKFGYGIHHSNESNQSVSGDSIDVNRYSVKANEFSALNAFDVKVRSDMILDAKKFKFQGAELTSSKKGIDVRMELDMTTLQGSANYSQRSESSIQHQKLNVDGKLTIKNANNGIFDSSQADVGEIVGKVESLDFISRTDKKREYKLGASFGVDVVTKKPEFSLSGGLHQLEVISSQTHLNVRGNSKQLQMDTLKMKGAFITFDDDVHNFAKKIITEDVKETENKFDMQFSISRPKKITKGTKTLGLSLSHKDGKMKSAVASRHGHVDDRIKQKVNTEINKCREVNKQFSFSVEHTLKGKLSKNIANIGKNIAKSAGKEITIACLEEVSKELGLPVDIVNSIIDIAKGENPFEAALDFFLKQIVIPDKLLEALDDLLTKGNPFKLIIWIGGKAKIPSELIKAILEVLECKTITNTVVIEVFKTVACSFEFPNEVVSVIIDLVKCIYQKEHPKDSILKFLKSQEGRRSLEKLAKWICGKMNLPPELVENTLEILFRGQVTNAVIINLIQKTGRYLNFPDEIVAVFVELIKCFNEKDKMVTSTVSVLKTKAGQKSIKDLGNLLGVPDEITDLILDVISQSDAVSIGQAIFRFIASKTNIPSDVVSAVTSILKDPNIKTFAVVIFGTVCKDQNLIQSVGSSIIDCKDTESVLKEILRAAAQHFGVSRNIIDKVQKILQGKCQPDIQTGIEFLRSLSEIAKKRKVRQPKLEQSLTIIQKCLNYYETFSTLFANCSLHGFSIFSSFPIFQLILELFEVQKELCDTLKSVIIDKNPAALKQWLPVIKEVDPDAVFVLAKDIINGIGIKDICVTLLSEQAKRLKLPDRVTSDLKSIIHGNEPQQCLKPAVEIISSRKDYQSVKLLSKKLALLPHQTQLVIKILNYHIDNKSNEVELFILLSTNLGVPQGVAKGIAKWVDERNPEYLACWIEKETGLRKAITIEFLRYFSESNNSETKLEEFIFSLFNIVGLSGIVNALQPIILSKKCLDYKEKNVLIQKIINEVVSPHVMQISQYTGIHSDSIENILNFSSPKDQCLTVIRLICNKVGLSNELFDAVTKFVMEKDVNPLASLIVKNTKMDSSLVKALLFEIRNTKSVRDLTRKLPMSVLEHVGLSKETVGLVRLLLSGKMTQDTQSKLLKAVIEDIMKSEFGNKIIQKIFGQAENQGVPDVLVSSMQSILSCDTPTEAVFLFIELLSEPIGLSKNLCKGIAQVFIHNNPSKLISYIAEKTKCNTIPWIQTLVETFFNFDEIPDVLQRISSLIMKEIGFSSKSIECVLKIYEGNLQPLSILTSLLYLIGDIIKICQPSGLEASSSACSFLLEKNYLLNIERNLSDNADNPDVFVFQLISLGLNTIGIHHSILSGLKSFIASCNCEVLISQICNRYNVDQESTSMVINIFSTDISTKQKIQKIAIFTIQQCKFSNFITKGIINIIQGNKTNKTALLHELSHSSCGNIALDIANVLEEISDIAEMQTEDLLKLISVVQVPGLPNALINALTSYASQNNFEPFAKWISEYNQIETDIIKEFLEAVFHKTGKQRILDIFAVFAKFVEMEENMIEDIRMLLEGTFSSSQAQTIMTKFVRFMLSKIANAAVDKGMFPKQILTPTYHIINGGNMEENAKLIASYFLQQLGIPKELIDGFIAFVQHRKTQALGEWVAKTTNIDRVLVFKLLEPFEGNENILTGIKLIPKQIIEYLEMPDRMVQLVEDLVNGKKPEGDLKSIKQDAMIEVLKSRVTSMSVSILSDRFPVIKHLPGVIDLVNDIAKAENVIQMVVVCVRYFANKFEISTEISEGCIELIQSRDPTKLVSLFAHKVGIDRRPLLLLTKVFTNQEITSVISDILKSGTQNSTKKDTIVKLLKSKEGQKTIREIANVFGVPNQITNLILNVINQSDAVTCVQSVVRFIAYLINLPDSIVSAIVSTVKNPNLITVTNAVLENLCGHRMLIQSIRSSSLNDCKDIKSAVREILRVTLQHFGISSKVTEYVEQILNGKCQLDFEIGFEIVKDLCAITKRSRFKNTKLDEVLSVIEKTFKRLDQFSIIFTNLTQTDFSISSCIAIVQIILEMIDVPKELCEGMKSLLLDQDLTHLKHWVPKMEGLEPEIIVLLANDIISRRSIKDVCLTLLGVQAKKQKLLDNVTTSLKRLINDNEPRQCLKAALKLFLSCDEDISNEFLCTKLGLTPEHIDNKSPDVQLFTFLATNLGIPQMVTKGIAEWVDGRNPEYLACWIQKETGLQKPVTVEFLKYFSDDNTNETKLKEFMFSLFNVLKRSGIVEALRPFVMSKESLEYKEKIVLIYKIIIEVLSPHLMEISQYTGIPSEIIEKLLNFSSPKDQCLTVFRFITHKAGISNELFDAVAKFVMEKDVNPVAGLIVQKNKMDSSLVKALLLDIRNTKSVKQLTKELPMSVLKHAGLSKETVSLIQQLLSEKLTKDTKSRLLKAVIADILKSTACKKFLQLSDCFPVEHLPCLINLISDINKTEDMTGLVVVCLKTFAPKLEIPTEIIEGFVVLLKNRDPEKLVSWLASKIGIDEKLLMAMTKAIVNKENPMNILKSVAKIAGFPEETVSLLEAIIKNRTKPAKTTQTKKKSGGKDVKLLGS